MNPLYIHRKRDSKKANQYRNILAALENLKVQIGDDEWAILQLDGWIVNYSLALEKERRKKK